MTIDQTNSNDEPTDQPQDDTNMPENSESTTNQPESTASNTNESTDNESTSIMDDDHVEDNTQQPEDNQKIDDGTGEDSDEQIDLEWKIKHIPADTEAEFIRATHYSLEPDELVQALVARFGTDPATAPQLVVDELDRINIEREVRAEQNYATEQAMLDEIEKRRHARHEARVERASAQFDAVPQMESDVRKTGASVSAELDQRKYSAVCIALEILSTKGFSGDHPLRTVTWRYFHEQLHIFEPDTGYRVLTQSEEDGVLTAEIENAITRIQQRVQDQVARLKSQISGATTVDQAEHMRKRLAELCKHLVKREASEGLYKSVKRQLIAFVGVFPKDKHAYYPIILDPSLEIDLDRWVMVRNGMLNLDTREMRPFDCRLLTINKAGFRYDPSTVNEDWLAFIEHQPVEVQETFRLWLLYILIPWISEQFLVVISPPNSGKGTLAGVIEAFVGGQDNCASCDIEGAHSMSGLLEHKSHWLITDERAMQGKKNVQYLKFLLNVVANDGIYIKQKWVRAYTARLGIKVSSFGNEMFLPVDAYGGIHRRAIVVTLAAATTEDTSLKRKILSNIAGIFNWALPAWPTLRKLIEDGGKIPQPAASSELREDYQRDSNALLTIMDEVFETAPDDMGPVEYAIARQHARRWTMDNISSEDIGFETLARKLDSAVSGSPTLRALPIKFFYKHKGGSRTYKGVRLRLDYVLNARYNDDHQFTSTQREDEVKAIQAEREERAAQQVNEHLQRFVKEQANLGHVLKPEDIAAMKALYEDVYKTAG